MVLHKIGEQVGATAVDVYATCRVGEREYAMH